MLKLVGTDGERFYTFELEAGKFIVGRKDNCDFCIPHKTVSRKHAEVEVAADTKSIYILDLGSHNGTFINGRREKDKIEIKLGDQILFGQTEFKLSSSEGREKQHSPIQGMALTDDDLQNSVLLPIDEALEPLTEKVTDLPDLIPTIFEMAKMLVLNEPKKVMLERSLELISEIIPCDRLAVLSVPENQDEVYAEATLLPGGKDPGAFTLSQAIVNEIVSNKNAILICNPDEDPRFASRQSIIASKMKSAMAVPLFDEGNVHGILYADTTSNLHLYNDEQLRILATFGNIIASRMANLILLREREEKKVIDSELRRASGIQRNLLVSTAPKISGYEIYAFQEQSLSVGGDLYDMKVFSDGRLAFIIADVSGKGMGAALLMSNLLASFRILYESENFDLGEIVKKVSMQMFKYTDPGEFATMFIGLAEPDSNLIRFINAGHNPPLIVRRNGTIETLKASGVMIGAFDFVTWSEESAELNEGDQIFIYTDGVTEAQHGDDQYGEERMEKIVANERDKTPEDLTKSLINDINDFIGDTPRSDDITIMILKRTHYDA